MTAADLGLRDQLAEAHFRHEVWHGQAHWADLPDHLREQWRAMTDYLLPVVEAYARASRAGMSAGDPVGERAQFLRLVNSLLDTYRPEGVVIWLMSHNRCLGDTPRRLIAAGEWQRLIDEADRLAGGAL